jgi:hypothetical protein
VDGQGSLCIGRGGRRGPFGARRERLVVGLVLGDLGKRLGHLQAITQLLFTDVLDSISQFLLLVAIKNSITLEVKNATYAISFSICSRYFKSFRASAAPKIHTCALPDGAAKISSPLRSEREIRFRRAPGVASAGLSPALASDPGDSSPSAPRSTPWPFHSPCHYFLPIF